MDEFLVNCVAGLILLIIVCALFFGIGKLSKLECKAKANALGYQYSWGYMQGCVLEKPNGQKILLKNLRYNELD